jgi:hypothetical protein
VLDFIIESRLSTTPSKRALAPRAKGRPFTFWFSTSSQNLKAGSKEREAFEAVEAQVKSAVAASDNKMKAKFNAGAVQVLKV